MQAALISNYISTKKLEVFKAYNDQCVSCQKVSIQYNNFSDILMVLMRTITIFIQELRENDPDVLITFKKISSTCIRIFYICQDQDLDRDFSSGLNFDPIQAEQRMVKGRRAANRVFMNNRGGNFW